MLAILSLLGDAEVSGAGRLWTVDRGQVSPNGLIHLVVPDPSFWDDVGFTRANTRGFRSEAELETWIGERSEKGYAASAQTMYDLSGDRYAGRMGEHGEPRTGEEAAAKVERRGPTGPFWALR